MREIVRILVDMDGLLTNFDDAACLAHGFPIQMLHDYRQPGEWSLIPIFARMRGEIMSVEEFWRVIGEHGELFWTSLAQTEWMDPLLQLVKEFNGSDWHVVTAPSHCPTSYSGKVKWLKSRLGKEFDRVLATPHKEILAMPGVILIDDNEQNIQRFKLAGGSGILFPIMGNCLHHLANNPVAYVREQIEERLYKDESESRADSHVA
jgi:hypothetical protein